MAGGVSEAASGSLREQVVMITGGRRVGSDLALMLAARGARVAMTYLTSREKIEQTIRRIESEGSEGLAIPADLSHPDQAGAAVIQAVEHFGRLDALVSMASRFRRTPFAALSPGDFDDMIAANLAAPYHAALAAAKHMLTRPSVDGVKGKIVFLGDWATDRPYKDYLPYLVAKGALTTLTLGLARELAPHIPVALIQPAMIEPPAELSTAEKREVEALTPLLRSGTPADVNRLVLYLLEGTNFVTGACFRVDGGRFLGVDG
jgi:pteridine reductase